MKRKHLRQKCCLTSCAVHVLVTQGPLAPLTKDEFNALQYVPFELLKKLQNSVMLRQAIKPNTNVTQHQTSCAHSGM